MRIQLIRTIVSLLLATVVPLHAAGRTSGTDRFYDAASAGMEREFGAAVNQMDAAWDEAVRAQEAEWAALQRVVERKWQLFVRSTDKNWVAYSRDLDARGKVDFETGTVTFEAVVDPSRPDAAAAAAARIERQARDMLAADDLAGKPVLDHQIEDPGGRPVTPETADDYLATVVRPRIAPEAPAYTAGDGRQRQRYSVTVSLVPDHIDRRARRYVPIVAREAARFGLRPQVVMAVIHTESFFNPKAVSHCNAVGMMQLIPRYGAREAYRQVYGADRVLTNEDLFHPEKNIELGCAYLSLLRYRHFRDVQGEVKNRYVALGGYNWGPTAMRKVVDRHALNDMSDEAVYDLLRRHTPEETRDYIRKVRERMAIYDPYFPA